MVGGSWAGVRERRGGTSGDPTSTAGSHRSSMEGARALAGSPLAPLLSSLNPQHFGQTYTSLSLSPITRANWAVTCPPQFQHRFSGPGVIVSSSPRLKSRSISHRNGPSSIVIQRILLDTGRTPSGPPTWPDCPYSRDSVPPIESNSVTSQYPSLANRQYPAVTVC